MTAVRLAADRDRAGPGIERELKTAQREIRIDARDRVNRRGRRRAEHRHLQAAVLLELEAVVFLQRLADGEADLLAAVIHAAPLRAGAVARKIRRKARRRRLDERPVDEHGQNGGPADKDKY